MCMMFFSVCVGCPDVTHVVDLFKQTHNGGMSWLGSPNDVNY